MDFNKVWDEKSEEVKNSRPEDFDWVEEPPTFDEHMEYGYNEPIRLSKKQRNSVISVIGEDPKKIFSPERIVSLGIFCVGKGGGKDFLIAPVMDYIIRVLLCLRSPQRFLGIDDWLDLLNVAVKGKQGEQVFFSKFTYRVKNNKWYLKKYKIYEKGKIVNNPEKPEGVIYINADNAEFPHRIRCLSESSKNETWEGYNVIFFVLDEISGFMSETQRENGWKIYGTANSSCISRRTATFKGIGFVISYPRKEKDDIIIELYKLSRTHVHIHGVFAFSWHFRPAWTYGGDKFIFENRRFNRFFSPKRPCPKCKTIMVYGKDGYICPECEHFEKDEEPVMGIQIPVEYKEDFDTDPEGSLTKYCCLPPRVSGEYFEYPEKVWACVDAQQDPLFLTQYYPVTKEIEGEIFTYRALRIVGFTEKDPDVRMKNHYVAWLDNAEVACDAVIAIARKEMLNVRREDGSWQQKEICRIVDVINWLPLPNMPIDLENVEDFLTKELPRYINLREVGADRWECLDENSFIFTNKGLVKIKDIVDERVATKEEINFVRGKKYSGKKKVYKITTKKGFEIEASGNHPFWNGVDWVELKDLKVKDKLYLKSPNLFPEEDVISADKAVLYGYLTSEGYMNDDKKLFSFTNSDYDLIEDYMMLCKKEFGEGYYNPKLKKYKDKTLKRKDTWTVRKIDRDIYRVLKEDGVTGNSYTKEVPITVRLGSKKVVTAFLSALFEGDGCVLGQKYLNTSKRINPSWCFDSRIQLETASQQLVKQVQLLLLNLGIVSDVKFVRYKLGNVYRLNISGDGIKKFKNLIGFRSQNKQKKLDKVLSIRESMKVTKMHIKNEIFIDTIKTIEYVGTKDTYDIKVENSYSFIADGFIVHNSALLSQKMMTKGIRSHRFNLSNAHYDTAKYFIYLGAVRIFDEEPHQEKSLKELTSLEQLLALEAGDTKPNKKSGLKKDKADAVVGCINLLMGGELTQNKKKVPTAQKVGNKSPVGRTFSSKMPATPTVKSYNPYLTQAPVDSPNLGKQLPAPRAFK